MKAVVAAGNRGFWLAAVVVVSGFWIGCTDDTSLKFKPVEFMLGEEYALIDYYFKPDDDSIALTPSYQILTVFGREFTFDAESFRVVDMAVDAGSGRVLALARGQYCPYVFQLCANGDLVFVCDLNEARDQPWMSFSVNPDETGFGLIISAEYGLSPIDPGRRSLTKTVSRPKILDQCGF